MATQATDRLEVVDFMPAVEKLWNDRYRLTFYCRISDKKEDWFGGNVSTFLPAFGELQGANFTGDGWSPRDGEEYSDMRLVEAGAPYISASGEHLVTLVYETISDTFTQEVDDETNKPKNGLRGVTRKSIAKSGTEYTGEIGVTTIQHQVNQETEITLYLAQVEIEDTDAYRRVTEVWLESGILSLQQELVGGATTVQVNALGLTETQVNTLLSEVTASHVLISQSESDYDGIKTSTFQYQIDETFTEDYELNGLKRISLIELSTTNFTAQNIGAESQTAPTNGLYLGTQSIDNGGIIKARESVWLEAGTLSISKTSESEGVMGVTTQFFGAEGTTVGPIISKGTDNYEGFPVISVKTLQDAAGNSLVNNDENLANSISGFSAFTYPGVIDVNYVFSSTSTNPNAADNVLNIQTLVKKAPAQTKVKTTMYFIFQSSSSITESDYTYASSDGLWSPNHWAGINATASGTADDGEWNDSATFRGYRTSSVSSTATINSTLQNNALLKWQGDVVVSDTTSFTYTSTVDQGPPDPIGNKYTLDVQISPAFDDVGGNKYYKKVITVTDAIPAQPTTASLPYVETP